MPTLKEFPMQEPREFVQMLECNQTLPGGRDERFNG
jgi:hypothetical protein